MKYKKLNIAWPFFLRTNVFSLFSKNLTTSKKTLSWISIAKNEYLFIQIQNFFAEQELFKNLVCVPWKEKSGYYRANERKLKNSVDTYSLYRHLVVTSWDARFEMWSRITIPSFVQIDWVIVWVIVFTYNIRGTRKAY